MGTMAAQITGDSIVYSNVCADADQEKHQSPSRVPFVREFNGDQWISRTKGQ